MKTIEIKQKLLEEALDQLKAAQQDSYVQSTQNVIDELELVLRQPPVGGRSEQLCQHSWVKHPSHQKIGAMVCLKCGNELA
jgi:hypothetical protein